MANRHLPVRPNLRQLKLQAKDLLRDYEGRETHAGEEFARYHPRINELSQAKLSDAQLVLARSYGVASWPRLVHACQMTDAIQRDEIEVVRQLIADNPELLHEDARGVPGNWGPPMSYAANLGRDAIIQMLAAAGARDVQTAFDRACLQGQTRTARWLLDRGANVNAPVVIDEDGFGGHTPLFNAVVSQANTCGLQQDAAMTKLLLEFGADVFAKASIRKRLRFVDDESEHIYQDVTPLGYGRAFHEKRWTRKVVLQLLAEKCASQ